MIFPIDMLNYNTHINKRYIVRFESLKSGTVTSVSPNSPHSLGFTSDSWVPADDTTVWQPINKINLGF